MSNEHVTLVVTMILTKHRASGNPNEELTQIRRLRDNSRGAFLVVSTRSMLVAASRVRFIGASAFAG
jgi:hypothetical protein